MQVKVDFQNPPREGYKNASIKVGDRYYGYDPAKFNFVKGGTYDIEFQTVDKNGKTYYNVTGMKQAPTGNGAASGERWWMPFVSNTVAHALQSGQITDPTMVKLWAAAAKQAAMELDSPVKAARDDSDVPY